MVSILLSRVPCVTMRWRLLSPARRLVAPVVLSLALCPRWALAQFPMPGGGGDLGPARFGIVAGLPTTPEHGGGTVGALLTFGGAATGGRRGGLGSRLEAHYLQLSRQATAAGAATASRDTISGVALLVGSELGGRVGEDVLVYASFGTGFAQLRERGPAVPADRPRSRSTVMLSLGFGVRVWNRAFAEWGLLTVPGSAPLLVRVGVLL